MVNVGEIAEVVNAEKVELTNSTDSEDYGQLYNITWSSNIQQYSKVRTDGTQDTLDGGDTIVIEGDVLVTQPEITTLVTAHTRASNDLPRKNWDLKFTAKDATTDTLRFTGKLIGLSFLAPEHGDSWYHLSIRNTTSGIAEP